MTADARSAYDTAMREALPKIARAVNLLPTPEPHPVWWRRLLGQKRPWTVTERIERANTYARGLRREFGR